MQKHCDCYIILNITFITPNNSAILHCIRSDLTRFRLDQTGAGHVRVGVVFSVLHLNCLIKYDQYLIFTPIPVSIFMMQGTGCLGLGQNAPVGPGGRFMFVQ